MTTQEDSELRKQMLQITGEPIDIPGSIDPDGNTVYIGSRYPKTDKLMQLFTKALERRELEGRVAEIDFMFGIIGGKYEHRQHLRARKAHLQQQLKNTSLSNDNM